MSYAIKRMMVGVAALAVLLSAVQQTATADVFSGSDDGAPATGPFPNSNAAANSLVSAAAAFGPVNTITFENLPLGFSSSFTAAPGVTVAVDAPDLGPGASGISNDNNGSLYGFNVTPGGSQWFGFSGGSATFSFANPSNSFGFYLTGVQAFYTSAITVTHMDGSTQTLYAPVNVNGGASYFGFTETSAFASVQIDNIPPTPGYIDAWGIDNVSYNATVPEPSSFISGAIACVAGIAAYGWRRRKTNAAA